MRTQEILTRVNEVLGSMDAPKWSAPRNALESLARDLEAQLRREIANSKGVGNAAKTIEKILNGAKKDGRAGLAYPWIDSEGRQCVSDGYVAFRLRNHLPLPERPENIPDGIDLDRVFPASTAGYKVLPMPSAKELTEFIAVERAKWDGPRSRFAPLWRFPDGPAFNAQYLLNAAVVFPNAAELFWTTTVSGAYITCAEGDGIVLPVRVFKGDPDESKRLKAEQEAEAERRENVRKQLDEAEAEKVKAREAQAAKNAALIEAEQAKDDAAKAAAMQAYYGYCDAEYKARLRTHELMMQADPAYDIEPGQFEYLVSLRYARENADHNAA